MIGQTLTEQPQRLQAPRTTTNDQLEQFEADNIKLKKQLASEKATLHLTIEAL
jgi:hypothetical protein